MAKNDIHMQTMQNMCDRMISKTISGHLGPQEPLRPKSRSRPWAKGPWVPAMGQWTLGPGPGPGVQGCRPGSRAFGPKSPLEHFGPLMTRNTQGNHPISCISYCPPICPLFVPYLPALFLSYMFRIYNWII